MTTFVDTSAFIAVLDADDRMHAKAGPEWERLLQAGVTLRTTNYVLVETLAVLQNRFGLEAVRRFTADVLPMIDVSWIAEGVHLSAQHALLIASRRDLSLVDCTSFEVMRRDGIGSAFCFDQHFSQQGFQVLPLE